MSFESSQALGMLSSLTRNWELSLKTAVGSVWLLYLLDYRISTAVLVGIIALVGLAAQTGVVMIVYLDDVYETRQRGGLMREHRDLYNAIIEGAVTRVRPKMMTVTAIMAGLRSSLSVSSQFNGSCGDTAFPFRQAAASSEASTGSD